MRHCRPNIILMTLLARPSFAHGDGGGPDLCGPSENARESIEISDHVVFGTKQPVLGATTLIRDFRNCVVNINVFSSALEANWAYSIWIVVFNQPEHCVKPNVCGVGDLEAFGGDPRVKASVFWGGGFVADGTGSADTFRGNVPRLKIRVSVVAVANYFVTGPSGAGGTE